MKNISIGMGTLLLLLGGSVPLRAAAEPSRAVQFAVMGYEGIQKDLASGQGPYLRSLLEILKIPADRQTEALEQIRQIGKAQSNILTFAEQVSALQADVPSTAVPLASVPVLEPKAATVAAPLAPKDHLYQGDALVNALEHLTRGMKVTVYLRSGEKVSGSVVDYDHRRLRLRGAGSSTYALSEIQAIESSSL